MNEFSRTVLAAVFLAAAALPSGAQNTVRNVPADTLLLESSYVSGSVSGEVTPLRLTDIPKGEIALNSPGRTFPEIIHNVPGVYATAETGSWGDASLNVRGFKQENISILLNGIPISGLTSGSMYWNNWAGLQDAATSIQLQKGTGSSMLSDNSVGGTVNIVTSEIPAIPSVSVGMYGTDYGMYRLSFGVNSGELPHGWRFSLVGSYTGGKSFIECGDVNAGAYSLTVRKTFNPRHSLEFLALGSPEEHQQRSSRMSYDELGRYGVSYNKSWGYQTAADGSHVQRTLAANRYYKPYFTLTHNYDGRSADGRGAFVRTVAYAAFANGGGNYSESRGKAISQFIAPEGTFGEGHIDWDAVVAANRAVVPDEHGKKAVNVTTDYLAGHTQAGAMSNLKWTFNDRYSMDGGLHYQYYDTWERERITDLLGADYWYEDYEHQSLAGQAGRSSIKHVGDYVRTDNGRTQHYMTLYADGTFKFGPRRLTVLTAGASVSGTLLQRKDFYNYVDAADQYSPWTGGVGGSVKAGVLQNLSKRSKIYFNAAFYSRVPYQNVFFSSGNNSVTRDVVNEKNLMGELGFRHTGDFWGVEADVYAVWWKDKNLSSPSYASLEEEPVKYLVRGLDAFHYGGEVEAWIAWRNILRLDAFASVGDWRWKNNVNATIYDHASGAPIGEVKVYADNLHVGDAPQTQVGARLQWRIWKKLRLRVEWSFNDRMWADFDPVTRTSPTGDSYRLPAYHLLNAGLDWEIPVEKHSVTVFANVNNITDSIYAERGRDGAGHDSATFTGYWANTRNANFGVRMSFGL